MRQVVWSPRAQRVLEGIVDYISLDDPHAARQVRSRLTEAGDHLGIIVTGRPARVKGYFEKSVPKTSHVLLYELRTRANREYLLIVDVVHTSRNWRKGRMPPG